MIIQNSDQTDSHEKMRIGWWNTHISPPKGKSRITDPAGKLAVELIFELLSELDVFFLGEVSDMNIADIAASLLGTNYLVLDLTNSKNRSKFNIGLIFDSKKVSIVSFEHIISKFGFKNYKIGVWIRILYLNELIVDFYAVHWSSRLFLNETATERNHFGDILRRNIEERRAEGQNNFIILGDFNDEPYNASMTTFLEATRDVAIARGNSALLYNPFWRHIICPNGYTQGSIASLPTGTYYYPRDPIHRWRVFDQMLFSSSFIGGGNWHLNEVETGVLRIERLVEAIKAPSSKIDHLPIVGEIKKEATHG